MKFEHIPKNIPNSPKISPLTPSLHYNKQKQRKEMKKKKRFTPHQNSLNETALMILEHAFTKL